MATITKPAQPMNVVATRISDTQAKVQWKRTATTAAPWDSVTVMRSINGAKMTEVATITSTSATSPTTWTDKGLAANQKVQYWVRANNKSGTTLSGGSNPFYNTPARLSYASGQLRKAPDGTYDIRIDWTDATGWRAVDKSHTIIVEKRNPDGKTWKVINAGAAATPPTAWDPTPTSGLNYYRLKVKAQDVDHNKGPWGAYYYMQAIHSAEPPKYPTELSPNLLTRDVDAGTIPFSWKHNPGGDNAKQTAFEIMIRDAKTRQIIHSIVRTSPDSKFTLDDAALGNKLANGVTYIWNVRTKGLVDQWSNWSAEAYLYTQPRPVIAVTYPGNGAVVTSKPVAVTFTYSQRNNIPMYQFRGFLYEGNSTVPLLATEQVTVDNRSSSYTWNLDYPFKPNTTYKVTIYADAAVAGLGLTSAPASATFTVNLLPAALVTLNPEFDPDTGAVALRPIAEAAVAGKTSPVDFIDVQRRIRGGDWVTIHSGIDMTGGQTPLLIDLLPNLNGLNEYRALVTADSGAVAWTKPEPMLIRGIHDTYRGILNWGPGFQTIEVGQCDPDISETVGRLKEARPVLGRQFPILLVGDNRHQEVSVSFTVRDISYPDCDGSDTTQADLDYAAADRIRKRWEDVGLNSTLVMWRDWTGRRVPGTISEISIADVKDFPNLANISFTVTRTHWNETSIQTLGDVNYAWVLDPDGPEE